MSAMSALSSNVIIICEGLEIEIPKNSEFHCTLLHGSWKMITFAVLILIRYEEREDV